MDPIILNRFKNYLGSHSFSKGSITDYLRCVSSLGDPPDSGDPLSLFNYVNQSAQRKEEVSHSESMTLSDAVFDLYRVIEGKREVTALYTSLTSGNDGVLKYTKDETEHDLLDLPVGVYHLIETRAPAGYTIKTSPITITMTSTRVTYDEGTTLSQSGSGITWNSDSKVYTMRVSNTPGVELPATGGFGTLIYTVSGISLILLAGMILLIRRKRYSR